MHADSLVNAEFAPDKSRHASCVLFLKNVAAGRGTQSGLCLCTYFQFVQYSKGSLLYSWLGVLRFVPLPGSLDCHARDHNLIACVSLVTHPYLEFDPQLLSFYLISSIPLPSPLIFFSSSQIGISQFEFSMLLPLRHRGTPSS